MKNMSSATLTTTDRIKEQRLPSQNIITRLRHREQGRWNGYCYNYRLFYTNIVPNLSIINVEKPPCYLRKFSLDGKYLIAFSIDQSRLEIYEYLGVPHAMKLIQPCTEEMVSNFNLGLNYEIRSKIFDRLFKLRHVVETATSERQLQLNRECSLFTKDNRYVILGASAFIPDDLRPNFYALYTNNESITPTASCPLEDYALYIIDMKEGLISDTKNFFVDKIILSHNQGLYLFNETLAVLSIQHQTIHIFHIRDGTFTFLRSVGRFCSMEEEFLYNSFAPNNNGRAFREPTINSLKHRILVFLFTEAKKKADAGDSSAIRRFYQHFDNVSRI